MGSKALANETELGPRSPAGKKKGSLCTNRNPTGEGLNELKVCDWSASALNSKGLCVCTPSGRIHVEGGVHSAESEHP